MITSKQNLRVFLPHGLPLNTEKRFINLNGLVNVKESLVLGYKLSDNEHVELEGFSSVWERCKVSLFICDSTAISQGKASNPFLTDVSEFLHDVSKSGIMHFVAVCSNGMLLNHGVIHFPIFSEVTNSETSPSQIVHSDFVIGFYKHIKSIQRHFDVGMRKKIVSPVKYFACNENSESPISQTPIIKSIYSIYNIQSVFFRFIFNSVRYFNIPWSFSSLSYLFHQISIIHNCGIKEVLITKQKKLLDFTLGFLMLMTLLSITDVPILCQYIVDSRNMTEINLKYILEWLMGVPAGLKLNLELSEFLGHFFHYHIQVWITYLALLEPYYAIIIKGVIISNLFGLSVFLSFLNDIVNILTFHIYCYYVYASKIYGLQFKALVSLARLFTGKKWNVLKQRVDSIWHDTEELALGTILFTSLLFLLPTTALYYVVFTVIRMPILLLQTVLDSLVNIINTFPVTELWIRFWYPQQFEGELHLKSHEVTIVNENKVQCFLQHFNQWNINISPCCTITTVVIDETPPSYFKIIKDNIEINNNGTCRSLVKKLACGEIISPWSSKHEKVKV